MMNFRNPQPNQAHIGRLKHGQRGMTLLEVLVSMFLLAVGVLALLATQLRTVASVREAESQTVVAQAVQNLMEGMMLNPTLSADADSGWTKKRYDDNQARMPGSGSTLSYKFSNPARIVAKTCVAAANPPPAAAAAFNKRQLLDDHLNCFQSSIKAALPEANVWYIICQDAAGKEMTMKNGTVGKNCTDKDSDPLYIKVLWEMDAENEKAASAANNGTGNQSKKIVYTYQARMPNN